MSRELRKFLLGAGAGLVLAFLVCWARGLFWLEEASEVFACLSDGFFVTAALLLGAGGLQWTYNGGVMDGLNFTAKVGIARMRRDYETARMSFADYRQEREKKATSPKWLLLAGTFHLILAFLFLVIYSRV